MIFHIKQKTLKTNEIPNIEVNHMAIELVKHIKFLGVLYKKYSIIYYSHLNYGITAWSFNVGPRISKLKKGNGN